MISEANKREMQLWAEERKKHDLKYPDEYVVRYLNKKFCTGTGKRILDFGCGSGRNTVVMADMGFEIYAVDYNEVCLELTREKLERLDYNNVTYLKNTRVEIPVQSDHVDCIVAWGALFYFNANEREENLQELHRVLKKDGYLFADYRTKDDFMFGQGREIEQDLFVLNENMEHLAGINYWFCSEDEIRNLYHRNGFVIENLEKKEFLTDNMSRNNSHWHVWAKKR